MAEYKDSITLEVTDPDTEQDLYILLDTSECAQVLPLYEGLNDNQLRAGLKAVMPTPPAGYKAVVDLACDVTLGNGNPQPVVQPQSIGSILRWFEVNGVLKRGYPFFNAVNGTAEPAITASNVYYAEQVSTETIGLALARVRAGGVITYPQSQVARVRTTSISSLTPSTTRPSGLEKIGFRGDPLTKDFRFWFDLADGVTLQWLCATTQGNVVPGAGWNTPELYQSAGTDYVLDGYQSTAWVKSAVAGSGGIDVDTNYLLGLRITQNNVTTSLVLLVDPPTNSNALVELPLPDTGTTPVDPSDPFTAYNLRNKLWYGLNPYLDNVDPGGGLYAPDRGMVDWSATRASAPGPVANFNYFIPRFRWPRMERPDGTFNYTELDDAGALALQRNIPLLPCFDVSCSADSSDADSYILPEDAMHDQGGNILARDGQRVGSYSSATVRTRHLRFLNAMLAHIKASNYAGKILGISVVNGTQGEHEFPRLNRIGGNNDVAALYDYSAPALADFRTRMEAKYTTIAAANAAWGGTTYSGFFSGGSPLTIPVMYGPLPSFATTLQQDWYNTRQQSLADYANAWHDAVKACSGKLNTLIKVGNMADNISLARGTIALAGLLKHDCIMQHGAYEYDVRYAHAVARRDGKATGDEVFFVRPDYANQEHQINQIIRAIDEGGSVFDHAGLYATDPGDGNQASINQARAWLAQVIDAVHAVHPIGGVVSQPTPAGTLTVSTKKLLLYTHQNSFEGGGSYQDRWNALTENHTKNIRVTVVPDL